MSGKLFATAMLSVLLLVSLSANAGMISRWDFDSLNGDGKVEDTVGTADLSPVGSGGAIVTTGQKFGAGAFSSPVNSVLAADIAYSLLEGTYELWVKVTDLPAWKGILQTHIRKTGGTKSVRIETDGASALFLFDLPGGGSITYVGGYTAITDGGWHMLALTYSTSDNEAKLYFDGSQVGATSTYNGALAGNRDYFLISAKDYWNNGDCGLVVDDSAVYDEALGASDVSDHYTNGIPVPEPATMGLLGLGGLIIGLSQKRRR